MYFFRFKKDGGRNNLVIYVDSVKTFTEKIVTHVLARVGTDYTPCQITSATRQYDFPINDVYIEEFSRSGTPYKITLHDFRREYDLTIEINRSKVGCFIKERAGIKAQLQSAIQNLVKTVTALSANKYDAPFLNDLLLTDIVSHLVTDMLNCSEDEEE